MTYSVFTTVKNDRREFGKYDDFAEANSAVTRCILEYGFKIVEIVTNV